MRDDYAQQYGELERWHWWFCARTRVIASVLKRELPNAPSRSILSVGCGPAEGLHWLQPFAGAGGRLVGLDPEPLHAQHVPEGVEFVVRNLEDARLPEASFDVVLALDVLEHLEDDAAGLLAAARLVKSGGLLLITVPALPSLWGKQDVVSAHHRRYTKRALKRLFEGVGLRDCRITYFNTLLFPLIAPIRWLRRALGMNKSNESDFAGSRPGLINDLLERTFAAERHLVNRFPLPIGVSLLATYTNVAVERQATAKELRPDSSIARLDARVAKSEG